MNSRHTTTNSLEKAFKESLPEVPPEQIPEQFPQSPMPKGGGGREEIPPKKSNVVSISEHPKKQQENDTSDEETVRAWKEFNLKETDGNLFATRKKILTLEDKKGRSGGENKELQRLKKEMDRLVDEKFTILGISTAKKPPAHRRGNEKKNKQAVKNTSAEWDTAMEPVLGEYRGPGNFRGEEDFSSPPKTAIDMTERTIAEDTAFAQHITRDIPPQTKSDKIEKPNVPRTASPSYDGAWLNKELEGMKDMNIPAENGDERKRAIERQLEMLASGQKTPDSRARMQALENELATLEKNKTETKKESVGKPINKVGEALTRIGERDPEAAARIQKTLEMNGISSEVKEKMAFARLEEMDGAVEAQLEKRGFGKMFRNIGEWYKNVPLSAKLIVAAGLATGAVFSGGTLAIPLTAAIIGRNFLASAATFVGIEAALRASQRSRGERWWNKHPSAYAGVAAALVLSGGFLKALSSVEEFVNAPVEKVIPMFDVPHTVQAGENVWNILKEKAQGLSLDPGRETYFIDMLKDKLAALSPEEIRAIGIESGDINLLKPGETIDFSHILNTESVESALGSAENISSDTAAMIMKKQEVLASFAAAEQLDAHRGITDQPDSPYLMNTPESISGEKTVVGAEDSSFLRGADAVIKEEVEDRFGSRGFFGWGAKSGFESSEWITTKDVPATSVLSGVVQNVEKETLTNMSSFIREVMRESDVTPKENENTLTFLRRGIAEIIKKQSLQ